MDAASTCIDCNWADSAINAWVWLWWLLGGAGIAGAATAASNASGGSQSGPGTPPAGPATSAGTPAGGGGASGPVPPPPPPPLNPVAAQNLDPSDRALAEEAERQRLKDLRSGHPDDSTAPPPGPTAQDQLQDTIYHTFFTLGTR